MKLAHVVNLFDALEGSAAQLAQQVTVASMHAARRAGSTADLTQFAITSEADVGLVPAGFVALPPLTRTVLDVGTFAAPRPLPLLRDILDALYRASDADFFIYTNADIGVQTGFYTAVVDLIQAGFDGFVINRRTIDGRYTRVDQLPEMMAEPGQPHPGWDCFIFRRAVYPRFTLGDVCVGAGRMGLALLANLAAYSAAFREFTDRHLTFHLGDDRAWRDPAFADYDAHNTREVMAALAAIEADAGPFARRSIPGRFLVKKRLFGPVYDWWSRR